MKKSTADHMHRKRRKNNLVWLFALLGILVLFLGTILAFLIFSNLSSKPTETVQEVSAVNGTGIVLPSHFTERKITDPSTARDAINDVADTLGIVSVEDELGTADCSTVLGDTYYSFPQVYRGIPVYGRKVTVSADADSEAALLTSGFYPIENLSVEAKITQNDAEKIVAGLYPGEADIYVNNLVIFSLDKTNPELASDAAEETQVEGYTGHLYEFYTLPESEWESGPITWQQAEKRCEWKGGHLAVIESSTENFLLYSAMKAKGYENAYFGFSDESSEGNWKWVNGTSTSYTNWHSGEPSNQDGIEHYAMFYEKFQDGTWNDADGIIDAGCAYICEWDDPTDKISQGDSFTDQQLRIIAKDLGVPDDLNVEIRQSPKAYWEAAGLWDIYVEITHNGKLVASGSFDVETGEMGRNIYIYTPV